MSRVPCLVRGLLRSKPLTCLKRHSKKKKTLMFPIIRNKMEIIRHRLRRLNKNQNRTGKRANENTMQHVKQKRRIRLKKRRSAKTTTSLWASTKRSFKMQIWATKKIVNCFKSLARERGTLMTRKNKSNTSKGRSTQPVSNNSASGWRPESVINLRAFLIMDLSNRWKSFSRWLNPALSSSGQNHSRCWLLCALAWPTAATFRS